MKKRQRKKNLKKFLVDLRLDLDLSPMKAKEIIFTKSAARRAAQRAAFFQPVIRVPGSMFLADVTP